MKNIVSGIICMGVVCGPNIAAGATSCHTVGQQCVEANKISEFGNMIDPSLPNLNFGLISGSMLTQSLCCSGLTCRNGRCIQTSCGTTGNACGGTSGISCCNGYQCVNNACKQCNNCASKPDPSTDWLPHKTLPNVVVKTYAACLCDTWYTQTIPACAQGYYSTKPLVTASEHCKKCPTLTDNGVSIQSTTSGPGAKKISECYIPRATTGTDTTGTFKFNVNCNYVEPTQ